MPASPSQTLPVRLTNGINTKDDELLQVEMASIENGVFQRPGSLRKRYGTTRYGVPSANMRHLALANSNAGSELLAVALDGLFSRTLSPTPGWSGSKGVPQMIRTKSRQVSYQSAASSTSTNSARIGDIGILNGIGLIAWIEKNVFNNAQDSAYCTLFDATTGAELISRAQLSGSGNLSAQVRIVPNGANLELWYHPSGGSGFISKYVFSTTAPPTTLPTVTSIADTWGPLDTASSGSTVSYVQAQGTSLRAATTGFATTMGSVIATATNTIAQVAAHIGTDGNLWIAWSENAGTTGIIRAMAVNPVTLAVTATAITVATLAASTLPANVAIVYAASEGGPIVFWETIATAKVVSHAQLTLSGTTLSIRSTQTTLPWGQILSKAFLYNGQPAIWLTNNSTTTADQPPFHSSAFLLLVDTTVTTGFPPPIVAAQALQSAAPSRWDDGNALISSPSNVATNGSDMLFFAASLASVTARGITAGSPSLAIYAPTIVTATPLATVGSAQLTQSMMLGASILQSYDGGILAEHNFLAPPDGLTLSTTGTGGGLSNGTYSVIAVYEWRDERGELQQSLPSLPSSITLNGGTSTQVINCKIRAAILTQRTGVSVKYYCTQANGQTYYESAADNVDASVYTSQAFITNNAGILSIGTKALYTTGSFSDDVGSPTPFLARAGDRLWGTSGNGLLVYTKKRVVTRSAEWSGLLTQQLSSFLSPNAIAEMSGNRIAVFADEAIAVFDGSGPDNTGSGVFNDDELISRSIGCQSQRNVLRWDGGVFFKSKKGWYNLSDGLELQYVGAKVESYNGYDVAGIAYDPVSNRIKVALATGPNPVTLLTYDTYSQTWSTEAYNQLTTCLDMVFWRDRMQMLDLNGYIWEQTPNIYADGGVAYGMTARTGWFAPADLLGFFYVKKIEVLGQKKSDHNLVVVVRYNYSETIAETFTISAGSSVAVGPYVWAMLPKQQQAYAMSIEIYDNFTGYSAGEGYTLEGIALELGFENGIFPLPAAQTIQGA